MLMDYKKIGLRAGLEIHQQLDSGSKLFCRCPIRKSEEFPIEVRRRLRPVQSELGEEDPAALFEFLKDKTFVYRANSESSCLIELDESPPLSLNQAALKASIQLAKMLSCSIVDEIHVMRKMVIDGSAVTGFQRTALIATDGYIETLSGRLSIKTMNLEEDSAPASATGEYRLDRLGVPLVEIATDATLYSPDDVYDAARKIGSLLRSLPVVRGIGSIRQDVNISIAGGSRVEIKGFQQLDEMKQLVENEALRQLALLEVRDELKKRGFREIKPEARDVTNIFNNTRSNFVRRAIDSGQRVSALTLPKFSGLLARQCGDRTLGKEMSAYPAAYGFGIIHSDEQLEKYSLAGEFEQIRKELRAGEGDAVVIIVGNNPQPAINALVSRANQCAYGVPEETRIADGTGSKYARPLPGSGRLYPESDVPSIKVTKELLAVEVPKTLDERKEELDIPEQLADQIVRSKYYSWFSDLKKYDATLAASIFLSHYKDLSRRGLDVSKIKKDDLDTMLKNMSEGDIPKNSTPQILEALCAGRTIDSAMADYYKMPDAKLREIILAAVKDNPGKSDSAIIGVVMSAVKGRADGKKVAELVKELHHA